MILFFGNPKLKVFAVKITKELSSEDIKHISWMIYPEKYIKEKTALI